MKAVLLITLLVICSCNTPVDIVKCFLNSDIIFKATSQLIEAIQSKDMSKLIGTIIQLYGPVYEEIKKCLSLSEISLTYKADCLLKYNKCIRKNGFFSNRCDYIKNYCKN